MPDEINKPQNLLRAEKLYSRAVGGGNVFEISKYKTRLDAVLETAPEFKPAPSKKVANN